MWLEWMDTFCACVAFGSFSPRARSFHSSIVRRMGTQTWMLFYTERTKNTCCVGAVVVCHRSEQYQFIRTIAKSEDITFQCVAELWTAVSSKLYHPNARLPLRIDFSQCEIHTQQRHEATYPHSKIIIIDVNVGWEMNKQPNINIIEFAFPSPYRKTIKYSCLVNSINSKHHRHHWR